MATKPGVELDAIEAARKSVIAMTLAHQTTARVARKQAVKALFGTLLGSWEAGVSFDKMAEALNKSGIDITTETLRGYFFELKTDAQLRRESEEHARAMAEMKRDAESRQRAADLQHARELAQAGTTLAENIRATSVEAAHHVAVEVVQSARVGSMSTLRPVQASAGQDVTPAGRGRRPQAPGPTKTAPPDATNVGNSVTQASTPASTAPSTTASSKNLEGTAAPGTTLRGDSAYAPGGVARTLDELARISQGQQESTLVENLVLRDGSTVWCESGQPFEGFLSARTIHTLRTVGKVIAPTVGRTARDFVPMSHEL